METVFVGKQMAEGDAERHSTCLGGGWERGKVLVRGNLCCTARMEGKTQWTTAIIS